MNSKIINSIKQFVIAVLTIILALAVGAILVRVSGNDPAEAYTTLFRGALGSKARISEVLVKMIPLTLMALGMSIAYKAQLWNIGANGQLTIGAILAILPGIYLGLPTVILLPLSLILSIVGGSLWCGLAAWLKNRFNANEVITTLMLNYIATYFLSFLVYGPMMDPDGGGFPQSKVLPDAYHLPLFSAQMRIHGGIVVAIIVIIMMFFFWRTKLGVKIDLIGQGDKIATYAGVDVKKTVMVAMLVSGALCGLAGWNEVYGVQYRLLDGLSSGYGDIDHHCTSRRSESSWYRDCFFLLLSPSCGRCNHAAYDRSTIFCCGYHSGSGHCICHCKNSHSFRMAAEITEEGEKDA